MGIGPLSLGSVLKNITALPLSPVIRGRVYEASAQVALEGRIMGLSLTGVGHAGDRGIDFVGRLAEVEILVQCKSSPSKAPGLLWRELIGACMEPGTMYPLPSQPTTCFPHNALPVKSALGILVSPLPMTAQSHSEFSLASLPLVHCILPFARVRKVGEDFDAVQPVIRSFLVNGAGRRVLAGLSA